MSRFFAIAASFVAALPMIAQAHPGAPHSHAPADPVMASSSTEHLSMIVLLGLVVTLTTMLRAARR
ncbi:MAG: hypothetical protein ACK5LJ_15170 [Paracoccus sp. (in: a-proteobacteria)]